MSFIFLAQLVPGCSGKLIRTYSSRRARMRGTVHGLISTPLLLTTAKKAGWSLGQLNLVTIVTKEPDLTWFFWNTVSLPTAGIGYPRDSLWLQVLFSPKSDYPYLFWSITSFSISVFPRRGQIFLHALSYLQACATFCETRLPSLLIYPHSLSGISNLSLVQHMN